ncbi:arsenate reductase family protein [Poseidonibacter ostreae]|jgi:arsenate reductase (glutaredoxin)|uniref:Spx/MgsR family RNA polymerase-binding regulatory protein n=1 Tax=Poseidonibacter ostreae TaxID=2654171 RepID=A0ABQ6VMY3_9BACT|nr:arsenate reductase family protein [Poseidonibacter ostreae]KAB7887469.1 Spx/MgsR family RNA polymerase-binding regulatory protein [Poseidonibacter ostreae]KAB7891848.1 Spx/MgsR family RNA polymerase-binding regulatory protein [Poseidonibacter ostreae]
MLKVYGIKTCDSVRKALRFFKDNEIEVDFFDFKKESPSSDLVDTWIEKSDLNLLFNSRGTKYRTLKLKELNLDDDGKTEWLKKEPMLFKRPVVEYDGKVLVAFNEDIYKETFL